ncbi:MAG: hypothetical protein ACOYXM_00970 [Actinomycetota bacterium]
MTSFSGKYPTYAVTQYPVIAEPPSEVGAVHDRLACPLPPEDAVTLVGTAGTVAGAGVTGFDAIEKSLLPTAFTARTLNR